jgi:hypothetical protein
LPRLDIGGLTLNVEERGSGAAFIFIPGLVGLFDAWGFQMAEFSQRYRCISFDHRGTGDSDKPPTGYTTDLIARDVIALMDTLGIDKARRAAASCRTSPSIIPIDCAARSSPTPGSRPTSSSRAYRRRASRSPSPTDPPST